MARNWRKGGKKEGGEGPSPSPIFWPRTADASALYAPCQRRTPDSASGVAGLVGSTAATENCCVPASHLAAAVMRTVAATEAEGERIMLPDARLRYTQ